MMAYTVIRLYLDAYFISTLHCHLNSFVDGLHCLKKVVSKHIYENMHSPKSGETTLTSHPFDGGIHGHPFHPIMTSFVQGF